MIVPPRATANSSANADLPLAVGPATRMTGARAFSPVLTSVRPSGRKLRGLLRMTSFPNAIKKAYLMLRSLRRARLEARRLSMLPGYYIDGRAKDAAQ